MKDKITGINKANVKINKKGDNILAQIKANNIYDSQVDSFNSGYNVQPYDTSNGTLYFLSGGGRFKTNDRHPEYIAAQLEQPRFKNCQYLVSLKKGGAKKSKLYKCTKKNGKVCSVVKHYK